MKETRGQLLLVCRANVCRSVYAHALLSAHLPQQVALASAGVKAAVGAEPCPLVRERCDRLGIELPAPVGRPCTPDLLADADLVLVMTRELQDAVARLQLSARSKTFTIPACVASLEATVSQGTNVGSVAELADVLNNLRGSVANPRVRPRLGLLGRASQPATGIPDGHIHSKREHKQTLTMLERQCESLAAAWQKAWHPAEVHH
ncbi:MAG: hypothetical protein QM713_09055 [Arachnia sp.]